MKQYAKYTEVKEKKKKKNIHSSFSVGRPCHRDAELQSAKLYLRINPSLPPPGEKILITIPIFIRIFLDLSAISLRIKSTLFHPPCLQTLDTCVNLEFAFTRIPGKDKPRGR